VSRGVADHPHLVDVRRQLGGGDAEGSAQLVTRGHSITNNI